MSSLPAYDGLRAYYGDLHNHCNISYGRGSIDAAYTNARMQLDFASVTGHAHWPDMPRDDDRLAYLVAYHDWGFQKLAAQWGRVQDVTESYHEDGRFVTFLSFEWHSMRHGDHCIYYKGSRGDIVRAPDIAAMREALAQSVQRGVPAMMIPHHICYLEGYRGINWADFDPGFTPVVEIVSMHGCAEDDDAPRPYLHSMGPRDGRTTMLEGLRAGRRFGIIGSTDHHSAFPGSHNHGLLGVWASELTRDGVWDAIQQRRTYALTGDRMELSCTLNEAPMGSQAAADHDRTVSVDVRAGGPLDYIEVRKNGEPIARHSAHEQDTRNGAQFVGKVALRVGWGDIPVPTAWDVRFGVEGGRIRAVEPRFHGAEYVNSFDEDAEEFQPSAWEQLDERTVRFTTRTRPNPNTTTDATQGLALEIEGDGATRIIASINGRDVAFALSELRESPRTGNLEGFVSPAFQISRAVPESEYHWRWHASDTGAGDGKDFYYVRVRQKNDHWAWSSPMWI